MDPQIIKNNVKNILEKRKERRIELDRYTFRQGQNAKIIAEILIHINNSKRFKDNVFLLIDKDGSRFEDYFTEADLINIYTNIKESKSKINTLSQDAKNELLYTLFRYALSLGRVKYSEKK